MENNLKARTDMLSCFSETRNPLSETAKERMRGLKKKQEKGQEDMNNNKKNRINWREEKCHYKEYFKVVNNKIWQHSE